METSSKETEMTNDPDSIPPFEKKRLIQLAMDSRAFPPQVSYPELQCTDLNLVSLFSRPVLVWVPEATRRSKKPFCVVEGCNCQPSVKERMQRVVEDVECKYTVLYMKYQCTGTHRGKSTTFSTLSSAFIQRNADVMVHLPFVLSKKMGFSKRLMEHVHEGILSPNGLSSALNHLERRRRNRYYDLLAKFVFGVKQNHEDNPQYLAPSPPTVDIYLSRNKVVSHASLTAAWITDTALYSSLCELVMRNAVVKKVVRMDHSVKFCKRLKNWEGHGQRENLVDAKMLLLLQNEIGQIVGRRLTSSENKDETMQLLSEVKSQFETSGDCFLISDNATAVRDFVGDVFGDSVAVKQDPFHVIQRFAEKVKHKTLGKKLRKDLSSALYDVDRELRQPVDMESNVRSVLANVPVSEITCDLTKWNNCIESNIAQIKRGDLYVADNIYKEGGGPPVRIVSTSQLEGFHSALKKLLAREVRAELGLRILDVFIVQHNLDVGARFGRNPHIANVDLIAACRAATVCKLYGNGLVAGTAEQEFLTNLVSAKLPSPQYRSATQRDFAFGAWQDIFHGVNIASAALESNLSQSHQHLKTIKELLFKHATALQTGQVHPSEFMQSLRMEEANCESAAGFSFEEHGLLRQVLAEQKQSERIWDKCVLVTTIMFNLVVASNTNTKIKLHRRSYRTLELKINAMGSEANQPPKQNAVSPKQMFRFRLQSESTGRPSEREQNLQRDLFTLLRESKSIGQKRKVFRKVYDFASCICNGIRAFTKESLLRRWEALKKTSRPDESCKITLKVVRSASPHKPDDIDAASTTQLEDNTVDTASLLDGTADSAGTCTRPTIIDEQLGISEVQYELTRPALPVAISKEHMQILVEESDKFKGQPGKTAHLMEVFRQFYPHAVMTDNKLRMRIRNSLSRPQRPVDAAPTQQFPPQPPTLVVNTVGSKTRKRKAISCDDCRSKHVKCGDPKNNPHCLKLTRNQTNTLASYFSTTS
ncbi:hypothetical protein DVH05_011918 [Phytophthora capsici]|nr:hypothetical protein DVH05_011918 [Phytophthora capsici]